MQENSNKVSVVYRKSKRKERWMTASDGRVRKSIEFVLITGSATFILRGEGIKRGGVEVQRGRGNGCKWGGGNLGKEGVCTQEIKGFTSTLCLKEGAVDVWSTHYLSINVYLSVYLSDIVDLSICLLCLISLYLTSIICGPTCLFRSHLFNHNFLYLDLFL